MDKKPIKLSDELRARYRIPDPDPDRPRTPEPPAWRGNFDREVAKRREESRNRPLPKPRVGMKAEEIEAIETLRYGREQKYLFSLMPHLYGMVRGGVLFDQAQADAFVKAMRAEFQAEDLATFFERMESKTFERWEIEAGMGAEPDTLARAKKLLLA